MMIAQQKQMGLSLIELMIAISIGAFLILGVTEIFSNSKAAYRLQDNQSRIQENGRFAIQILSRDIRMVDYTGCRQASLASIGTNADEVIQQHVNVNNNRFSTAILGTDLGQVAASVADPNDRLQLIHAANRPFELITPYPATAYEPLNIASGHTIEQGDFVLVSNCQRADIFQVTNSPQTSNTLEHSTGAFTAIRPGQAPTSEPGNINNITCDGPANAHCLSAIYNDGGGGAFLSVLLTKTYDIQTGADGRPALFLNGAELIGNIDNLQILYGVDNTPLDLLDNVNYYAPYNQIPANEEGNIVSVRIALVAESPEDNLVANALDYQIFNKTVSPSDRRIRRVFTATISVRNRLLQQ